MNGILFYNEWHLISYFSTGAELVQYGKHHTPLRWGRERAEHFGGGQWCGAEEQCDELELVNVAPGRCRDFVSRASDSNVIPTQQSDLLLRAFVKQPLQTCYP